MSKTTYLVTGGAGFIGSHLVETLLEKGMRVRVLDDFSTGRQENIASFLDDIELFEGDIRDERVLARAVKGCNVILHHAALPSVARSVEDPLTVHTVNTTGTLTLLCAARDAGVERVVYASSSSIYGGNRELPKREEMKPAPLSPYATSKLVGEYYCGVFTHLYGLRTVCLRYFNVFGPRQDPDSQYAAVIPNFFTALCENDRPVIHGDGEQTRDFTYVGNVAAANIRAASAPVEDAVICNIACGERTSVNRLLELIGDILDIRVTAKHDPPRRGDVRDSLADITRARELIGYRPAIDLEEGLRRTAEYYRSGIK